MSRPWGRQLTGPRPDQVRDLVCNLVDLPDAVEPFERIREAIKEAVLKQFEQ